MAYAEFSTGLPGFDAILKGILPGDNIVWQVDSVDDYQPFALPFLRQALADGRRCIYFRFARHQALVPEDMAVEVHRLEPEEGFESFITEIHRVIEQSGRGACYVFDSLSDLVVEWCSDRMVGNFFMLTCPYLYDLETIAYFAVLRGMHTAEAIHPITETTQLFLDVYRHRGNLFVQPLKVLHRYSPTMHMLHAWQGDQFSPIVESTTITEILTAKPWYGMDTAHRQLSIWDRAFMRVEEVWAEVNRGTGLRQTELETLRHILRMVISRDDSILHLAERYLTLGDLLAIRNRMIGTGLVGGKAVGMLLARAILKRADARWASLLEPHDSFFIGSDVFYTFLVQNGCWWVRAKQRDPKAFLEGAEEARRRILTGVFPEEIQHAFAHLLNYYGQSPIIVRSSSLLEDNYGNAFAGKYDSVFCANQGPHEKRLESFMSAVRTIYASTMSEKALRYRAQRGLLQSDEQMALLVQRVSGSLYEHLFYPQVAGVGLSFNPYAWSEQIDPEAGMLRLVFGLGTRAVDRYDDDYTRVVALNAPLRRPEHNFDAIRQYAQRKIDTIDWEANRLLTCDFDHILQHSRNLPIEIFASREQAGEGFASEGSGDGQWVLTFDKLLTETPFVQDMRELLKTLEQAYDYPIEAEFTANFFDGKQYKINLLQCRPLQVHGGGNAKMMDLPEGIAPADIVLEAHGAVIGTSRVGPIDRIIYVVPSVYGLMPVGDRYGVARRIGRLTHLENGKPQGPIMLIGPGRWGTTSPNLGICVTFQEINTVSVLCEIVAMHENLVPDVSLGTHFFNELVEAEMLYVAVLPNQPKNILRADFFETAPNKLATLAPDLADWSHVIKVIDPAELPEAARLNLYAHAIEQRVVCYLEGDSRKNG